MILELIAWIAFIFSIIGLSFLIAVPFNGILVRHRANYRPRRLHLSEEGDLAAPSGLSVTSFFGMFKRVHRVEGWAGFYKGFWPTIISFLTLSLFLSPFMSSHSVRTIGHGHSFYNTYGLINTIAYCIAATLIMPPAAILTNRAITTSHKLSFWNFSQGLRVLLTDKERKNPLSIYLTPGLVVSQILHNAIVIFGLGFSRHYFIVPLLTHKSISIPSAVIPVLLYLLTVAASVLILTPLEVLSVRLSIQRSHHEDESSSVVEELPEYAGLEEDVIELREDEEPYYGLIDCAKKIVNEEGWRSLYRAWWVTLLIPVVG